MHKFSVSHHGRHTVCVAPRSGLPPFSQALRVKDWNVASHNESKSKHWSSPLAETAAALGGDDLATGLAELATVLPSARG